MAVTLYKKLSVIIPKRCSMTKIFGVIGILCMFAVFLLLFYVATEELFSTYEHNCDEGYEYTFTKNARYCIDYNAGLRYEVTWKCKQHNHFKSECELLEVHDR